MAFLWVVVAVRNVYEVADAALALDCRAVDERQQDDWYKPTHIGLFVQNVDGAKVKSVSAVDCSKLHSVKRARQCDKTTAS